MSAIINLMKAMAINVVTAGELLIFLWQRKLWWLIPMTTVLLFLGLVIVFASSSGAGPFIYALF
jgi:hypothetical protein